jgi:hypothetical protein
MENNYSFKLLTSLYNEYLKDAKEEREKLYKIFGKPKSKYHN